MNRIQYHRDGDPLRAVEPGFFFGPLGSGLAMAGATMTAQYVLAGRQDMVDHVAAQTMLMVEITSVVFGALGFAFAPALLELLGVAPEVFKSARGFLRVSFVGIIFVFMYAMFQALMRGVGQTRTPLLIASAHIRILTKNQRYILTNNCISGKAPRPIESGECKKN